MRQVALALIEVKLEIEPHGVLENAINGWTPPTWCRGDRARSSARQRFGGRRKPAKERRRHRDVFGQVEADTIGT